ncbi:MAG: hypothetical protein KAJ88_02500 [Candidatus Aenigmarchaeota archaeon]|nr:hypothetical protein [Candidatus Aenigmarchaeota archaeon]
MGKAESVINLLNYGTSTIIPQVDSKVMKPIFEESLKKMSFYSPTDILKLWKTEIKTLHFEYFSGDRGWPQFDGTLYALSKSIPPYISIKSIELDDDNEIIGAISEIVKLANLDYVDTFSSSGFSVEITELLKDIKRRRADLKYKSSTI